MLEKTETQEEIKTFETEQNTFMKHVNLAQFAIESLAEHTAHPEEIVFEILSLIVHENKYGDFNKQLLPQFFQVLANKFDKVLEKVKILQIDSDKYQSELSSIKSSAISHSEEMSNEKLKRQIIEKEYDKISA